MYRQHNNRSAIKYSTIDSSGRFQQFKKICYCQQFCSVNVWSCSTSQRHRNRCIFGKKKITKSDALYQLYMFLCIKIYQMLANNKLKLSQFLEECSMCSVFFTCVSYAEARNRYRLDVRLSVTRWHCIKTAKRIVMLSSPCLLYTSPSPRD